MTIIYAVVCRAKDAAILVEVCDKDVKGTFGTIMVELLQHLRDHPDFFSDGDLKTFVQRNTMELDFFSHFLEACSAAALGNDSESANDTDNHFFHLYLKNGVYYCCLSDDADTRDQKVNFAFLMSMEKEFVKMYRPNRIQTANAYSLSNNFSPTMRSSMHYHNIHAKELRQDEAVSALLVKVENIRTVMGRNLNMILERGVKFENLLIQSENLNQDAQVFKKRSKAARGMMQRRYYFTYAILLFIVAVFLYMTVVSTCGFRLEYCRASSRNSNNENSSESTSEGEDNSGGN